MEVHARPQGDNGVEYQQPVGQLSASKGTAMPTLDEINQQQQLLTQHRRSLAIYLQQLGQHGTDHAPPSIINGIYETCREIRRIQATLSTWGISSDLEPREAICACEDFPSFLTALKNIRFTGTTSRQEADKKVERAREKIREWGKHMSPQQPWPTHAWHVLGHALELAYEAAEWDLAYQKPWNMLADVYHRIGKTKLAQQCLHQSRHLATDGPNFPGQFHNKVDHSIRTGYPFDTVGGLKREAAPPWFEQKYERYWSLPGELSTLP
jgi:hypothetical protein